MAAPKPVVLTQTASYEGPYKPEPLLVVGDVPGGFTPAAAQADSTATTVAQIVSDFNTLLANLRSAGIIAES